MLRGRKVRRESWRRWIFYTPYYLWFSHIPATTGDDAEPEQYHVVRNSEYQATEFLAADWTDEPWDIPPVTPRPCAAGWVWDSWFHACVLVDDSVTSVSGGSVTPPPAPSGTPPPDPDDELPDPDGHWSEPGNPPGAGAGGGGGGGDGSSILIVPPGGGWPDGTGSNSSHDHPPHNPPVGAEPAVTANVQILQPDCYSTPLPDFVRVLVEVSIQGGPAGVGGVSVGGGVPPQTSTGWPGMVMVYDYLVPPAPGGTLTISITYHAPPRPGGPDYTITASAVFSPYCYGYP